MSWLSDEINTFLVRRPILMVRFFSRPRDSPASSWLVERFSGFREAFSAGLQQPQEQLVFQPLGLSSSFWRYWESSWH
jgi:hypothetical protein